MIFCSPDFPANIILKLPSGLMLSTKVYLNISFYLFLRHALWSVYQINFQPTFTTPYPLLALASTPIPASHLVPPPRFHFFPITYQYHIRHSSPQTQVIFLPYMMFECSHNIRNQPVSTTIPCSSSFCDITTIMKQHFGDILKYVFSYVFQDSTACS